MRLNRDDKEMLENMGYPTSDFAQIENAIGKTKYTMDGKRISAKKAIEILGKHDFLSGIARSAFHWTSMRGEVSFDSSKIFEEVEQ